MLEDDLRIPPPGYRSAPQRRAAESRRMMLAAGGLGAVLLLGVVGYVVASGGGPDSVPVIQAPAGPVREKPVNPGGLQISNQSSALLGNGGSSAAADFAPAPEVPDPAALAAAASQEQAPVPPSGRAAARTPGPLPQAPAAPSASAVAVPSIPETPAPAGPQQTAMDVPAPSKATAAVHDLAQEYHPPSAEDSGHGEVRVQLAALDSREAALREWDHLTRRMPSLFDGRHPLLEEAHVDGHTFWRVRTAGFASVSEASHFCDDVRAHGGACTVALF